jgi:integrase
MVTRRVPRTLDPGQVTEILGACEHLSDRFLMALLAETGIRIGQALGLRHADFLSRKRELRIVPRADNANGARAKVAATTVVPVSVPLVRLYSEYMHAEYGEIDSDYVFVNLWGGRRGIPMSYPTVCKLVADQGAHRRGVHRAHAAPHARDRPDPPGRAHRGRRPAPDSPVVHHDKPGLHPPGGGRYPGRPQPGRRVERRGCPVSPASAARAEAAPRPVLLHGDGGRAEAEYLGDRWNAGRLGVPAPRGRGSARFDTIAHHWLRDPVKAWCRFRLATGCAFTTISASALGMARFSAFLTDRYPGADDESAITRDVLEHYLSWLATGPWSVNTRLLALSMLRVFPGACRRHDWLPGLPHDAVIYEEELPDRASELPRFIPEFVMAQLESPASLARLPTPTARNMIVVLIETGLRGGDACTLEFSPLIDDSAGGPCLRFRNLKIGAEQLIPVSAKAAAAIRAQQDHDRRHWPAGTPWLFPGMSGNADGSKPYNHATLGAQLRRWQDVIDLRDEAGAPTRVTAHRFRHTLGTRLINTGVPQHVVQKLLKHASPEMTAHYARIHDHTVRDEFNRYQQQRVNISGDCLPFDPDGPTATAEWVKHNLARVRDSLPNGYCGRPPQQDCPHPNACLTCPDFQTTPVFLDIHRRQATANAALIAGAEADGRFRLAGNLRQVQASLDKIIPALEGLSAAQEPANDQA